MEILGLLDSLEEAILNGFKVPLTKKIMVNEEQVLALLDKIRLVAQGGSNFAKKAIDKEHGATEGAEEQTVHMMQSSAEKGGGATDIVQSAYQIAKEIREGADKYADEVLSNLELTSTRVLRTIRAGRDRLSKNVSGTSQEQSNV